MIESMLELCGLVELLVVELRGVYCINTGLKFPTWYKKEHTKPMYLC